MVRFMQRVTIFAALLAAIGFAGLAVQRARLPYDENGRYFDPASGTVHDEQAVITYTMLAICFALVAAATHLLRGRLKD